MQLVVSLYLEVDFVLHCMEQEQSRRSISAMLARWARCFSLPTTSLVCPEALGP